MFLTGFQLPYENTEKTNSQEKVKEMMKACSS